MTTLLVEHDITIKCGSKLIISNSDLILNENIHYGIVGPNGCGKSTLISYIVEKLDPLILTYVVDQHTKIDNENQNVFDFMLRANMAIYNTNLQVVDLEAKLEHTTETEFDKYNELINSSEYAEYESYVSESKRILNGLGIYDLKSLVSSFSGGWRMRLTIARALISKPSVLIMDEPTNHLDLNAVVWLGSYLESYKRTLIITSHQIDFINKFSDWIWYIGSPDYAEPKIYAIKGSYEKLCKFIKNKQKEANTAYNKYTSDLTRIRKEAQGSTHSKGSSNIAKTIRTSIKQSNQSNLSGQNQSESTDTKIKSKSKSKSANVGPKPKTQADVQIFIQTHTKPRPPKEYEVKISFSWSIGIKQHSAVVRFDDVTFAYDESKPLLTNSNFGINLKDRYCIVGPNGVGKTTLFKLCMNMIQPVSGTVIIDSRIKMGYYNQQVIESVRLDLTPVEYLQSLNSTLSIEDCRRILGKIGLKKIDQTDPCLIPIELLSGGQKARVSFCAIQIQEPHILLFDEPTNHLDIEAIEGLIQGINEFQGGVVIISHDVYLIDSIENNQILEMSNHQINKFNGSIYDYVDKIIV